MILIRIYGKNTEVLIDRQKEIANFKLLHKYGFAARLLAVFNNGISYEYSNGKPLTKLDVYDELVWRNIARRMAEMHRDITTDQLNQQNVLPESTLWTKIRSFFELIPTKYSDPIKQKRFVHSFQFITKFVTFNQQFNSLILYFFYSEFGLFLYRREQLLPSIIDLRDEYDRLYLTVSKIHSPVVFAHNDLLLGNILYDPMSESKVTFIDYEYADYSFQAYDIGNHFDEFAGKPN